MHTGTSIFLIGPMGSGKSAVGKRLAARLRRLFYDSDREIERRTGVDVAFVFEKEGEEGFRRREHDVIAELTGVDGIVLATGGGAVLDPENRRHLAGRGYVIYLEASVDAQYARTRTAETRPLLAGSDGRSRLEALIRVREPLYREIADHVVRTDGRRVEAVAAELERHWLERSEGRPQ
jgi:shikimate kinase